MTDIYPDKSHHPYYIVAPPYSRFSAGVRVLHLLCHALNQKGQLAYLLILPDMPAGVPVADADLLTPRLTQGIMDAHFAEGRAPVVVYPEVISGNPLRAPLVARYVLNVPGLLGGDAHYAADELIFSYSEVLAANLGERARKLFMPVSNTRIYNRTGEAGRRSGSCYYARKYKALHPHDFKPPEPDSIEITWTQSPEELAAIYRRVEKFYCYESTSAALDAALCGCPTVSLPNEHLTRPIGAEAGMDGHAWGDTSEEIARAKATIGNVYVNYQKSIDAFWNQLQDFITSTQVRARAVQYRQPLHSPLARGHGLFCTSSSVLAILRAFLWRGDLHLLGAKAVRTIRQGGARALLRKLRSGTVG